MSVGPWPVPGGPASRYVHWFTRPLVMWTPAATRACFTVIPKRTSPMPFRCTSCTPGTMPGAWAEAGAASAIAAAASTAAGGGRGGMRREKNRTRRPRGPPAGVIATARSNRPSTTMRLPVRTISSLCCLRNSSRWCAVGAIRQTVDAAVQSRVAKNTVFWNCVTSAKRWLNGTTSRNAKSTCTPGSATRSSPSISWRLRSSRSDSVSSRPVSGWRSCWSATGTCSDGYEREPLRARVEREPDEDAPFDDLERDEDERDRVADDRELDDERDRVPPDRVLDDERAPD